MAMAFLEVLLLVTPFIVRWQLGLMLHFVDKMSLGRRIRLTNARGSSEFPSNWLDSCWML